MVKVNSDTMSTNVCLIKAAALPRELLVIVAKALFKPRESNKEITVPIRLINPLGDLITLHKRSKVAYVTRLDPNVNSQSTGSIIYPNVTPGVNTTELEWLWELVCGSGQWLDAQQQNKLYALRGALLMFSTQ